MGVSLLYVIGSRSGAVNRMGSENEVEQSRIRPRTVTDGAELDRLRTAITRKCLSQKTALSLVHRLTMSAEKQWRWLSGLRYLADVIADVKFIDGVEEKETGGRAAAFRRAIPQI